MSETTLRAVFQRRPYTSPIADGEIPVPGAKIDFTEVDLISKAMPAVCNLAYDIGEITFTDYLQARDLGKPLVGLPVFVTRNFLHNRIWYHTRSGIAHPKDLEGKTVGIKSYPQTATFWNRAVLASEYGVDVSRIRWVYLEGAHNAEYTPPTNVVPAPEGATLADLLESGEIDAADDPARPFTDAGVSWEHDPETIKPLLSDTKAAEAEWYARTGVYPILHMIVLRRAALERLPSLAGDLFAAFTQARDAWMPRITNPDVFRQRGRDIVGRDFLPYGVDANLPTIEFACRAAHEQGVTSRRLSAIELFDRELFALPA
ncbi:ABC transporter substrate-binding protein [Amaricoccus solimangrovi]|nr:ABC transporter substrate-binding protein [Amaricoccus solimangrovi]